MKKVFIEVKAEIETEIKKKLRAWGNIKSKKMKGFIGIVALFVIIIKILVTVISVEWFSNLIII